MHGRSRDKEAKKDSVETEIAAFDRIYRRHVAGLVGYARRFVPEETAEDIVHDIFVSVWRGKRFLMPADDVRFFLYRSVLNGCKNYLKHLSRTGSGKRASADELKLIELDFLEANLENTANEYLLNMVYANLGKLPPKCREIFEQVYIHRKKSGVIALEMNISRRTVEAQLYKALKILRDTLLFLTIFFGFA
jgi:RNA polymerase sigma-70 factor (ECF subfamily)